MSTIDIARRLFHGEPFDDVIAHQFVKPDLEHPILAQIRDSGVLINNFSLGTLAKVALRLGEEKNDHGRFPSHQDLGEALLVANDQATVRMDVALIGYSAPVH